MIEVSQTEEAKMQEKDDAVKDTIKQVQRAIHKLFKDEAEDTIWLNDLCTVQDAIDDLLDKMIK